MVVGALILGRWWSHKAIDAISVQREHINRIFLGEKTSVRVKLVNEGLLPLVWLQLHESLPLELAGPETFKRVVSLGPKGQFQFEYYLEGRKRGFYQIGPLNLYSGDFIGVVDRLQRTLARETITVYPKIIPLSKVEMPSNSPVGTLRYIQPVFEDPSRILSKRAYVVGDSMRRVDWKTTAATGQLQVKKFEPSISLETALFLNLNSNEYDYRAHINAAELAIVVAASLANWIMDHRQAVGLFTNGIDPLRDGKTAIQVPPKRGRWHLMRILEILARIETSVSIPLVDLLNRESIDLPWGTTLIIITNQVGDDLFDALIQMRRRGLNAMLILVGFGIRVTEIRKRASYFGFPLYIIQQEKDLDIWR